jgi:hypothetical protein
VIEAIQRLIEPAIGGDPMCGLKWCRTTPAKIATHLQQAGIQVGASTVRRLLTQLLGVSLRVNHKKVESGIRNPPKPKERDDQFLYIDDQRQSFARQGLPTISVDTKKKDLIGNFKNAGRAWKKEPTPVYDHDFPSDAVGRMVPYGIYDTQANHGFVCVGNSAETPAFAVDAIERWWLEEGSARYAEATELLILADCGGANGHRSRVWKYRLQKQLCDVYDLTVTVCHYPPGASKWNPIEHRVFSEISKNWAGEPLMSFQAALHYMRTTKTDTGLQVEARYIRAKYETGEKVPQPEMNALYLKRHDTLPAWNYTLAPAAEM